MSNLILNFDHQINHLIKSGRFDALRVWNSELQVAITRPSNLTEEQFLIDLEKYEFVVQFRRKPTKDQLLKIILLSHYLDKSARTILLECCIGLEKHYHLEFDVEYQLLKNNKAIMLLYLDERYRKYPEQFFGWLLQEDFQTYSSRSILGSVLPSNFWRLKQKPSKVKRKRGYNDHGSLGSIYSQTLKQQSTDYQIMEAWNQTIKIKEEQQATLEFVQGWIS